MLYACTVRVISSHPVVLAMSPFESADALTIHSLDDYLHLRAPSVYLVRVEGNSMQGAGIFSGDLLVVDRQVDAKPGHIVIAAVNGEPMCKRFCREYDRHILRSENKRYPDRYILEGDTFEVWGVVVHSIRSHD